MNLYVVNLIFAAIWIAITGSASLANIIFGFLLGAFALWLIRHQVHGESYWSRIGRVLSLVLLFFKELALSAWKVATLVLRPRMQLKPGIFAYPLTVTSDFEITLLANLITLTPGTLSVDVSDDRRLLYVHAIDCSDIEATKRDIAEGFERKIMEAFR
jgi:multicomponent Na+:H+ antiporter subunit E